MKKLVTLLSFAALLAAAGSSYAQTVPRTVLVEEGTNWSCGPCATYNPGLETWLKSHEGSVIHLAYHPNWPGPNDPMYLNDKDNNQYRVATYYSISGVPSVVIDGGESFVPSAPELLEYNFQTRIGVGSPVAMTVTREVSGTNVNVHVTLHPVQDMSRYTKLYLRVAAVEESVAGPGPNGEKQYVHAERAMMPGYSGTLVKLGTTDQSFDFTYPIKTAYKPENLYEVAFLQDDASKEVVQATTDRQTFQLVPATGQQWIQRVTNNAVSLDFSLNSFLQGSQQYSVKYVPTSKNVWPVTINGQPGATDQAVTLATGETSKLTLSATPGQGTYSSGILIVTTTVNGEEMTSSFPVKFIASDVNMAYVDISGDSLRSANTISTMDAMQLRYVPLTSGELVTMNGWNRSEFHTLIVGGNKWVLGTADRAGITNYLTTGGHLFIQGGEIAFGLADAQSTAGNRDTRFLSGVLHATYVKDSAGPRTVHGVDGDLISGDYATTNVDIYANDVDQPNQPDQIKILAGATPVFYYGTGTTQGAGLRWEFGENRLVYLAFGLQNLAANDRTTITQKVLDWFNSPVNWASGVDDLKQGATGPQLHPNYPNPFFGMTSVSYSVTQSEPVQITVSDVSGRVVATLVDKMTTAGNYTATFDASSLSAGTYFCVMHTPEGTVTRTMTVK